MAILKPLIQKLWASGGAVVQPSDTKIETGWTAEVPPHQWENWIQNRQDQYLAHINERGIPEWDGSTDYLASGKSYVQGSDGVLYKSVAASGPSSVVQDPPTDATNTYWTPEIVPQSSEVERGTTRVATQAETNAGTLDTVSVTPKKLRAGFSFSFASNGYMAFPTWMGGMIIQWGLASLPGADTTLAVTLPMTFTTAPLIGLATDTGPSAFPTGISFSSNSSTIVYVSPYVVGSGSIVSKSNTANIFWFALGH